MKILVTGANGYLGVGIVKTLLDKGNNVIAVCHSSKSEIDSRAIIKQCDIFEIDNPYIYFERPDILLHLAWKDGFKHYSNSHIDDLPKHYNFIKKMVESGCKKIVIMGSMHEIGFYEGSINEFTPCNPTTPYGISKNALRQLTQEMCSINNIKFQWLRGFYIVSSEERGNSIFSKIVKAEKSGKTFFPFTYGQNQYDFIDYADFCNQVVAAISQDKINGTINISSGKPEKLADRVEKFIFDNNFSIKLEYGAFPDRPYDSKAVWGDPNKIESILRGNEDETI